MLENTSSQDWKIAYILTQQGLLPILLQMEAHIALE